MVVLSSINSAFVSVGRSFSHRLQYRKSHVYITLPSKTLCNKKLMTAINKVQSEINSSVSDLLFDVWCSEDYNFFPRSDVMSDQLSFWSDMI